MLNKLITSKTRLRLLIKFFINQANRGYLNGLASEFNESTNSIRKELNNLSEAGYLEKYKDNNKVGYKANVKHPLFEVLQKVVFKHLGIEEIVERVLERMGAVNKIYIIGVGGVDSGNNAFDKLTAGANAVQLYTGMIYKGPGIVKEIKKDLISILKKNGLKNITESVGINA